MNPIKQSLDAHRWDGLEVIEEEAPFNWRKWLYGLLGYTVVCVGLAAFFGWMLVEFVEKGLVRQIFP